MKRFPRFRVAVALAASLLTGACAHSVIPNTAVPDNPENREVIAFLERYRKAVERRDAAQLITLCSEHYFDDMGTVSGDDDMDREGLGPALLRLREEVLDARYSISYRGITVAGDRAWAEVLYSGWFKMKPAEGEKPVWRRRLQSHRIALVRKDGHYKIVSGI